MSIGPLARFLFLKELFCARFARSNLYSAKEKLKIVSVRGEAAHFMLTPTPEPRSARRGNAVRAIFKIHRTLVQNHFLLYTTAMLIPSSFRKTISVLVGVAMVTGVYATIYLLVQQSLRQGGNDPQIQMAEDAAAALAAGAVPASVVPRGSLVDTSASLAPFIALYDDSGRVLESSGIVNHKPPMPPAGVFAYTRQHGQDRVTWQPSPDVRLATVIVRADGKFKGFVLAARSLREVERRTDFASAVSLAAWLATLALGAVRLLTFRA